MQRLSKQIITISLAAIFLFNSGCSTYNIIRNENSSYSIIKASSETSALQLRETGESAGDPRPGIGGVVDVTSTLVVLAFMWAIPIFLIHSISK